MLDAIFQTRMKKLQEQNEKREQYNNLLNKIDQEEEEPNGARYKMTSPLDDYDSVKTEFEHTNQSLQRVKSLRNHLSSNVALIDIQDLEQHVDENNDKKC